jgi:cell division protein FtsL
MAKATGTGRAWRQRGVVQGLTVLFLALLCALAVVQSTHACRQLHAQLQVLEAARWELEEEYGRLLLEQSTWASHHRVEKVALDELGMTAPALSELRVIVP